MTATARISPYRSMTDAGLAAEVQRLSREIDKLDDHFWPRAAAQRERLIDDLTHVLAEQARRRI